MHKKTKIFLWVAIIAIACLIFRLSGQEATESTDVSQGFLANILKMFSGFCALPKEEQLAILLKYDRPVRKMAHFSIYAILGFLIACQSRMYDFRGKKQAGIVATSAFFYACSDELHQRFVPGRSGQWSDVWLDTAGAITGYLFFLGIAGVYRWIQRKCDNS